LGEKKRGKRGKENEGGGRKIKTAAMNELTQINLRGLRKDRPAPAKKRKKTSF